MPLSEKELQHRLGLNSKNQVRYRVAVIEDLLKARGGIIRGHKNKKLFTDSGVIIIEQLEGLVKQGKTVRQAGAIINEEAGLSVDEKETEPEENPPDAITKQILRARIAELENERDFLRGEHQRLLDVIDRMTLALPPPKKDSKRRLFWQR